jgi:hypothetical protein
VGDDVKVTIDGIDGDDKPTTGKFDGKNYSITRGVPSSDTRSLRKINDHTLTFSVKKSDKVTTMATLIFFDR